MARRRPQPLAVGLVTPETTVYAICPGRGFDDATTVLGADFAGVLVRDGWVSYRCYRAALHQSCLNHLLRRCKELQEDHPDSLWAGQVQAVLQTGLAVRDRCNDGELSEHGLASVRGRLVARLGRLIDAPPPLDDAERFARHLATEFSAVFLFLWDLSVDATNWRAEQAIRPAVVTRKVCGGNRTRHGADTQQVLASVVRTARQRDLDLPPLIATMLRATGPVVPRRLRAPPAARLRVGITATPARREAKRIPLGVEMVNSPNFSLFTNVTRHDNLHNMKRIALTSAEFMAGGMPCALHVNVRTDMTIGGGATSSRSAKTCRCSPSSSRPARGARCAAAIIATSGSDDNDVTDR